MCDLSVIIVSWNTRELLRACLTSIAPERETIDLEVIVVDNASADGSAAMVAESFPWVRLIASNENLGFAAGNNRGLDVARGRQLLLLNPDTEVRAGALASAAAFLDRRPDAGVVGCRVWLPNGDQQNTMFRTLRLRHVFLNVVVPQQIKWRLRWMERARFYRHLDVDAVQEVDSVSGCFMLARREAWEQAGGLDESFFMYGEELEWCHRIRRAGWRVLYFPDAEILHHSGASAARCSEAMCLELARSQLLLLQVTRGRAVAMIANTLMLLRDLPRAMAWSALRRLHAPLPERWSAAFRRSTLRFRLHLRGLLVTDWRRVRLETRP